MSAHGGVDLFFISCGGTSMKRRVLLIAAIVAFLVGAFVPPLFAQSSGNLPEIKIPNQWSSHRILALISVVADIQARRVAVLFILPSTGKYADDYQRVNSFWEGERYVRGADQIFILGRVPTQADSNALNRLGVKLDGESLPACIIFRDGKADDPMYGPTACTSLLENYLQ